MKLLFVTSAIFPSHLANRLQIVSMARAFNTILLDRFILGIPTQSVLEDSFSTIRVSGSLRSPFLAATYIKAIRHHAVTHVYCREDRLLFFIMWYARLLRMRTVFVFEAHWVRNDWLFRWVIRNVHECVVITRALSHDIKALGVPQSRIFIAPDGVDIDRYKNLPSPTEVRRRYNITDGKRLIGYTGSIGAYHGWKGVDVLLEASRGAPEDWLFWVVGGDDRETATLRQIYPNVRFEGHVDASHIPAIQATCDVLVLPNKDKNETSERHTSPMKLFEYMASGTPIIASDLLSIGEVLDETSARLVPPDNPTALTQAIHTTFHDLAGSNARAQCALSKVNMNTWNIRAQEIINVLRNIPVK